MPTEAAAGTALADFCTPAVGAGAEGEEEAAGTGTGRGTGTGTGRGTEAEAGVLEAFGSGCTGIDAI